MSVCGHETYFKCALISINSYAINCNYPLYVFTDNPDYFQPYLDDWINVNILNFDQYFDAYKHHFISIEPKIADYIKEIKYHGYVHHHIKVAGLLPMAQCYFADEDIDWILKVDCDGYFAGGDVIDHFVKETFPKMDREYDLVLIERKHQWMYCLKSRAPGVGFTLWRKAGTFIKDYIEHFVDEEQKTILLNVSNKITSTALVKRPGYHFVYPFKRNPRFTKEHAKLFLPAYFHLGGSNVHEQMLCFKHWFERMF